ncbi:DNA topology modulation protein [Neobacillus piezotolerans]|uniref:DNA topology modulation protein n=1 Tax=Neobacillus piezotolerans TaxID=2259171 RepID=A0A3D8GMJ4_9BACI|nr:DNA topology modulation protein [Neobacillus piezotolerans]RDU35527.1 DNA topology modulation protein [Neobacillus piezotolerans]
MKRIAIIGSGGAGKSTFARKLGKKLGKKVYHLDALFWKPGWVPMDRNDFLHLQNGIMEGDEWIIDGNFGGTMDARLEKADTVIFLHYSTIRCLYRVVKRRIQYQGRTRPDMGEGCPEKLDLEFISWVAGYNRKKAPFILEKLAELKGKQIYIFTRPSEAETFLRGLNDKIIQNN